MSSGITRNPETPSFAKNLAMQGLGERRHRRPAQGPGLRAIMRGGGVRQAGDDDARLERRRRPQARHPRPDPPARDAGGLAGRRRRERPGDERRRSRRRLDRSPRPLARVLEQELDLRQELPRSARSRPRSAIESEGDVVTRGYILQRFISACAGRGAFPIKFNGSIFTVEEEGAEGFADYRRWGPGYWWQNTRLPYMSMPASGDFDLMRPFFRMYSGLLPLCAIPDQALFRPRRGVLPRVHQFLGDRASPRPGANKNLAEMPERIPGQRLSQVRVGRRPGDGGHDARVLLLHAGRSVPADDGAAFHGSGREVLRRALRRRRERPGST